MRYKSVRCSLTVRRGLKCARFFLVLLLAGAAASAQEACHFGSKAERDAFIQFDRELRAALKANDRGKLALLTSYPLRVNDPKGKYVIQDPAAFVQRIDEVLPLNVREAILKEGPAESIGCNTDGFAYGNGDVWVDWPQRGFGISAVNLREDQPSPLSSVQFTCNTKKERAIVESSGDKSLRLRVWLNPHSINEPPDVQLANGTAAIEGTNVCAHAVWVFDAPNAHYRLERLGCTEDTPPQGAIGHFESNLAGKQERAYCF